MPDGTTLSRQQDVDRLAFCYLLAFLCFFHFFFFFSSRMADPTLLDKGVFLAVATHGSALSLSGGEEEGGIKRKKRFQAN